MNFAHSLWFILGMIAGAALTVAWHRWRARNAQAPVAVDVPTVDIGGLFAKKKNGGPGVPPAPSPSPSPTPTPGSPHRPQ